MEKHECIGDYPFIFTLPKGEAAQAVPRFKWVSLNWNPHGHHICYRFTTIRNLRLDEGGEMLARIALGISAGEATPLVGVLPMLFVVKPKAYPVRNV